jgi:predicted phosphodiesterase
MKLKDIVTFLEQKPGYLKYGKSKLAGMLGVSEDLIVKAKQTLNEVVEDDQTEETYISKEYKEFLDWKKSTSKRQAEPEISTLPKPYTKGNPDNVLVIGDIHEPFSLEGYLEFCRAKQEEYNCGQVVFIGDVIDLHYSSYHETNTCALGADDELDLAIAKIANWNKVFPKAHVCIGNHDRLVYRKANTSGLSSKWIKDFKDVLNTPEWKFIESVELNDVLYVHGEGSTASKKMLEEMQSVVQGHRHTEGYVQYSCGKRHLIFGMQVGTGIDHEKYAFGYSKHFKKPIISCGVVLNGTLPILLPMPL